MSETPEPIAVVIAIGNSDDKLTQRRWSEYLRAVDEYAVYYSGLAGIEIYGRWHSAPDSPFQNAGWSMSFAADLAHLATDLKNLLRELAYDFNQDSIAWTTGTTELVGQRPPAPVRAATGKRWSCGCATADCEIQWTGVTNGAPDPLLIERVLCGTHGLHGDSSPRLQSLGHEPGAYRSQALSALDDAHTEQCR